jgi:Protein of unknown function (DUF3179)
MRIAIFLLGLFWAGLATANPDQWAREWPNTDFSRTSVESWDDIMSGGPPKDGIPALDEVSFIAVADETRIAPREPVIVVALEGEVPRAYPIRYLTWHEIVNDMIGNTPVAVTYCPLCNSAIVFDRRLDGRELSFGVSGKLNNSNLVMYDRQTESWWQQAVGVGIVGEMTGKELKMLPVWMESLAIFRERNPDGLIMDEPDWRRAYGRNPYQGYDGLYRPFLYSGELPPFDIPALSRVIRVGERAWPLQRLADLGEIREAGMVLSWEAGQASALDTGQIGEGRDVGNVRVRDAEGNDVAHDVMFAFAFHAFWPEGTWMIDG